MSSVAPMIVAQTPGKALHALPHGTSRVILRVRPPIGDTLHMRMDQTYEIYGDSSTATSPPMTAKVQVCTRAIALRNTKSGTDLLTITDSVEIEPSLAANIRLFQDMKRALDGRSVRMHMANDGGIRLLDEQETTHGADQAANRVAEQARALAAQMPPMLPSNAVAVGDSWTRDIPIPLSATHEEMGSVRATFRLDSLAPDQAVAYVSMHGTFSHARPRADESGSADSTVGTIDGTLQVDRRLEWMTDSRTTVSLTSLVWSKKRTTPMRVHMRITQWLRAVPAA